MANALDTIVAAKHAEVAERKAAISMTQLEAEVAQAEPARNFFAALTRHTPTERTSVIAEIKRKSPSAGWIRDGYKPADGVAIASKDDPFRPEDIARRYHAGGASAISCLTDGAFFGGDLSYIERVREAVPLPVLRKDFIVDPWQIWESRAAGADAVLLIAECLTEGQIVDMMILAQRLGMTVLLEVHSAENLLRVKPHVGFPHPSYCLLGINNRDLSTMTVDLGHTMRLADLVEEHRGVLVSESGIRSPEDLKKLRTAGVQIVLVGETLMRQDDPGAALADLLR
ncbi:MAG: indole-3-glycerol phosphate synthase TrpC [Planctomycetota bacterium]